MKKLENILKGIEINKEKFYIVAIPNIKPDGDFVTFFIVDKKGKSYGSETIKFSEIREMDSGETLIGKTTMRKLREIREKLIEKVKNVK